MVEEKRTKPAGNILGEMTALPVGQSETIIPEGRKEGGANFSASQEP